jgi:hypothetical protein
MMTRIRRVIVASLAMLAVASTCFSQVAVPPAGADAAPGAPAAADSAAKAAAPAKGAHRVGLDAAGRAGVGGLIGGSYFYASDDYSKGALPRFDFSGHWRYSFSDNWRGQISVGFTWSAYNKNQEAPFTSLDFPEQTTKEGFITQLVPSSIQIQRRFGGPKWHYHVGIGPGIYRVMVQDERKVQKDPITYEAHQDLYGGFTVEYGMERFAKSLPSTSFEINAASHYVFSEDKDRFPSGFNSALGAFCVRMGVNYYFDTGMLKPKAKEPLPRSGGGNKK